MTTEQEKILDKFKEIWVREKYDLKSEQMISAYYVFGLLLEVFEEINKDKLTGNGKVDNGRY